MVWSGGCQELLSSSTKIFSGRIELRTESGIEVMMAGWEWIELEQEMHFNYNFRSTTWVPL